jgi:hypothetical protein
VGLQSGYEEGDPQDMRVMKRAQRCDVYSGVPIDMVIKERWKRIEMAGDSR